jgi:phytoene/squalene synthetase
MEQLKADDWAAMRFLREAADVADNLTAAFPDLGEELTAIRRSIDEQLARFS